MSNYSEFLSTKAIPSAWENVPFKYCPKGLFPFQRDLVEWGLKKGRAALFEDCGLGKTIQQLTFAENVLRVRGGRALVLTPLAVQPQTVAEAHKFGLEAFQSRDGKIKAGINVTNYEQLHKYSPRDFSVVVCDESSILKNFDGKLRKQITEFALAVKYRLLCTATPAPNDWMELGTSSEALGEMTRAQMLSMFFQHDSSSTQDWIVKGHARRRFWEWVSLWARAVRKPSDLGHDDNGFILPEMELVNHIVGAGARLSGMGFGVFADTSLQAQMRYRRETLTQRCEAVAALVPKDRPFLAWCHYNEEGDLLEKLIPGAVQVKGSDSEQQKEERLHGFSRGEFRVMITKPTIAGFGMNWQHCADMSFFPSHSYEQFYQALRRCWRFGQKRKVTCHVVSSPAERGTVSNMRRKEEQMEEMFKGIVALINETVREKKIVRNGMQKMELPSWL